MALRIEEPGRLRVAAVVSLAVGFFLIDEGGFGGPLGWIGIGLFCGGTALVDGLGEGKVGPRQAGIFVILGGLAATTWALMVILLTHSFLEVGASAPLYILLVGGVAMLVAGALLRRVRPAAVLSTWTRALRASIGSSEQTEAA
jgi:hypothetical protein